MKELLESLNTSMAEAIGITFLHWEGLISTIILLCINFVTVGIIARYFYYPRSQRRDYMCVFVIMATCIFLLVSLMNSGSELQMGAALGLFAIFGIIRYRTEAVPIREMTYLFMLVAVSVVNAMGSATWHNKMQYWDGIGLVTILLMNLVFIGLAWYFENKKFTRDHCSKFIKYDNVTLVAPEKRAELIADLEKRVGVKIIRVEVGMIDFLKDSVLIRIFYDEPMDEGSSIAHMARPPRG